MKHCAVILHVAFEDLDAFEQVFEANGYRVTYFQAGVNDLHAESLKYADVLVVMGGPIGANDEQNFPFLTDELKLLEYRLRQDRPTLGICLGAQLMARALGASVYPGKQPEIGWSPLKLTTTGEKSVLTPLAGQHTQVLHWHNDTFEIPADAVHLASTGLCRNQAFSLGRSLALQFHPEVSAQGLERWHIGHIEQIQNTPGASVAGLRATARLHADMLNRQARSFLQQWLTD